jgi:hypothetical protein
MERTLDSFGISPPSKSATYRPPPHVYVSPVSLTACLSCRLNTVCCSSESCPSSGRALPYFDNYGARRVGHGFQRAGVRDGGGTKMGRGSTCRIWLHDVQHVYSKDEQLEQNEYIYVIDIRQTQVLTSSQTEPRRNPTLSLLRPLFSYRRICEFLDRGLALHS